MACLFVQAASKSPRARVKKSGPGKVRSARIRQLITFSLIHGHVNAVHVSPMFTLCASVVKPAGLGRVFMVLFNLIITRCLACSLHLSDLVRSNPAGIFCSLTAHWFFFVFPMGLWCKSLLSTNLGFGDSSSSAHFLVLFMPLLFNPSSCDI